MHRPLPVHPRTGLTAVGVVNGRPVWPILGASEPPADPPSDPAADPPADPPADPDTTDTTDWKAESRKHEGRSKKAQAELDKANAELAKLKAANQTEQEKAVEAAKKAGRAEVDADLRSTRIDLAVYRMAGRKGIEADADAVLDSRAFRSSVDELDPSAADFDAKVEAAIKDAVKANPKLKATPAAPGRSGGDAPPGGSGGARQRPSLGTAIAEAYKT